MTWRYITLITYHLPLLSLHLLIFLIPFLRLITFTRVTSQCIFTPCNFPFTPNPTTRETPDSFRWISDTPRSRSFSFPWITQAKRHLGATGDPHTRRLPAFLAKAKTSAKKKKLNTFFSWDSCHTSLAPISCSPVALTSHSFHQRTFAPCFINRAPRLNLIAGVIHVCWSLPLPCHSKEHNQLPFREVFKFGVMCP